MASTYLQLISKFSFSNIQDFHRRHLTFVCGANSGDSHTTNMSKATADFTHINTEISMLLYKDILETLTSAYYPFHISQQVCQNQVERLWLDVLQMRAFTDELYHATYVAAALHGSFRMEGRIGNQNEPGSVPQQTGVQQQYSGPS